MAGHWKRVDRVFELALDLNGPERENFVVQSCKNDLKLETEVRQYLKLAAHSKEFLEGAPSIPSGIDIRSLCRELIKTLA